MNARAGLLGASAFAFAYYCFDSRAAIHEVISLPLLRAMYRDDAEAAHRLSIGLLRSGWHPTDRQFGQDPECLRVKLWGKEFANPVCLAAGFDKHAEAMESLFRLGFGAVEIGSVTPEPQPGNPRPRVFRLPFDHAVINRYGFNSDGVQIVESRLQGYRERHPVGDWRILGVNLGKNKWSATDSTDDYINGVDRLGQYADYLVINVSSPNTPGLRSLQAKETLRRLIVDVISARDALVSSRKLSRELPVLIKLSPDLAADEMRDIAEVAMETAVDGVIISNTTIARPQSLYSAPELTAERGGLSGAPLRPLALKAVHDFYRLTKGNIPIIGCGGISNGPDALAFILEGASLIQLYTSMLYRGPGVVRHIKDYLTAECARRGVSNIGELVGLNHQAR